MPNYFHSAGNENHSDRESSVDVEIGVLGEPEVALVKRVEEEEDNTDKKDSYETYDESDEAAIDTNDEDATDEDDESNTEDGDQGVDDGQEENAWENDEAEEELDTEVPEGDNIKKFILWNFKPWKFGKRNEVFLLNKCTYSNCYQEARRTRYNHWSQLFLKPLAWSDMIQCFSLDKSTGLPFRKPRESLSLGGRQPTS